MTIGIENASQRWVRLVHGAIGVLLLGAHACGCSPGERGLVLGYALPESAGGAPGAGGAPDPGGQDARAGAAGAGSATAEPTWLPELCAPTVEFTNATTAAQARVFTDAVPAPEQLVKSAARHACRVLYTSASQVKPISQIGLVLEEYEGIAFTSGATMHLSASYLRTMSESGVDVVPEIRGILNYTTSLVYQNDGDGSAPTWLVRGLADFTRLRAGLIDAALEVKGGNYDSSSKKAAFFFAHLSVENPDIVPLINQRLAPGMAAWSDDAFATLTGSDLETLWSEYQAALP